MREVLDVGCGARFEGTVNIDVFICQAPNFVLYGGNPNPLPFRDNAFLRAVSNHVIEHLDNPHIFLEELIRVAYYVRVVTPHRFSRMARSEGHKNFFSCRWFRDFFKKLGLNYEVQLCISSTKTILRVPLEIIAECWK